jgi:hypothetical protein
MPGIDLITSPSSTGSPLFLKKEFARDLEEGHHEIDEMVAEGDARQEKRLCRLLTLQFRRITHMLTNPEWDELMNGWAKFDQ